MAAFVVTGWCCYDPTTRKISKAGSDPAVEARDALLKENPGMTAIPMGYTPPSFAPWRELDFWEA